LAVHSLFLFHPTTTTEISTLSLHDALPISVNWITEDVGDDVDVERFKFTGQVSLTREIGGRLGLAAVPSILFNPDELEEGENPLIALGLGTRWNFYRNLALVGEWIPILSGYTRTRTFGNINRFDTWGGGLE